MGASFLEFTVPTALKISCAMTILPFACLLQTVPDAKLVDTLVDNGVDIAGAPLLFSANKGCRACDSHHAEDVLPVNEECQLTA
jgi:hypothetical protein